MIKVNGKIIISNKYPNKETNVKDFIECLDANECLMELKYESDEDLIALMFVKKRLDEIGKKTNLFIWYMPYSRMDREIEGNLFTLKYICDFIGSLNFNKVIVMEPHSKSTIELFKTYKVNVSDIYPVKEWIHQVMNEMNFTSKDHIVYPDKGAKERYAEENFPNLLTFDKRRNPYTGKIEGMSLREDSVNKDSQCIIIDDLCSKGGTFMGVGKALKEKGAKRIALLVAHCENTIFEGNLLMNDSPIDIIYTSDSILTGEHPKIKKLTLEVSKYGN